jgi:hypothetical protein
MLDNNSVDSAGWQTGQPGLSGRHSALCNSLVAAAVVSGPLTLADLPCGASPQLNPAPTGGPGRGPGTGNPHSGVQHDHRLILSAGSCCNRPLDRDSGHGLRLPRCKMTS